MTEGTNTMPNDDLRAIEARHQQDATWFNGGLHDPNGYVAMAHKDRGVLLERLRLPHLKYDICWGQPVAASDVQFMKVPKAAWDWLMGQGPDDKGGTMDPSWMAIRLDAMRSTFRRMCGL